MPRLRRAHKSQALLRLAEDLYVDGGEASCDRRLGIASAIALTSGVLRLTGIYASITQTITQVRVMTNGTPAAATPTLCRIGVYEASEESSSATWNLVASTANDTALWGVANNRWLKSFSASFTKTAGKHYLVGCLCVTGTTAPQLFAHPTSSLASAATELAQWPPKSGAIGSQTDLPNSFAQSTLAAAVLHGGQYAVLLP